MPSRSTCPEPPAADAGDGTTNSATATAISAATTTIFLVPTAKGTIVIRTPFRSDRSNPRRSHRPGGLRTPTGDSARSLLKRNETHRQRRHRHKPVPARRRHHKQEQETGEHGAHHTAGRTHTRPATRTTDNPTARRCKGRSRGRRQARAPPPPPPTPAPLPAPPTTPRPGGARGVPGAGGRPAPRDPCAARPPAWAES